MMLFLVALIVLCWLALAAREPYDDCPPDMPHKGWGLNAGKCCKTAVNKFCHAPSSKK